MNIAGVALRTKESTFSVAAQSLANEIRSRRQKLRSSQYKNVVDSCVLAEDDLDAAEHLLQVIESIPESLDTLCSRGHNILDFPWYMLGASLWCAYEKSSERKNLGSRILLSHIARVLRDGGEATKQRMRSTFFSSPGDLSRSDRRKQQHDEDKRPDVSILTGIVSSNETFDVRSGDLFKSDGQCGMIIGRSESKEIKRIEEQPTKRAKKQHAENDSSSESDDSSDSDEDDMKVQLKGRDTRSYTGKLRAVFLHTMECQDIDPKHVSFLLKDTKSLKVSVILRLAIVSRCREANAVAGLLLQDEWFPTNEILDEVSATLRSERVEVREIAYGVFASVGNRRLCEELLVRDVVRSNVWILNSCLRNSLGASQEPPVLGDEYLSAEFVDLPPKEELKDARVRIRGKTGGHVTGIVKYSKSTKSLDFSFQKAGEEQRIAIKVSDIRDIYVPRGTAHELSKRGVNVLSAYGRKCLIAEDSPSLLANSETDTEVLEQSSLLSSSMVTCPEIPNSASPKDTRKQGSIWHALPTAATASKSPSSASPKDSPSAKQPTKPAEIEYQNFLAKHVPSPSAMKEKLSQGKSLPGTTSSSSPPSSGGHLPSSNEKMQRSDSKRSTGSKSISPVQTKLDRFYRHSPPESRAIKTHSVASVLRKANSAVPASSKLVHAAKQTSSSAGVNRKVEVIDLSSEEVIDLTED